MNFVTHIFNSGSNTQESKRGKSSSSGEAVKLIQQMVTSNTLEQCQHKMMMLEDQIQNNETHLYNLSDKYEKYYDKFEE